MSTTIAPEHLSLEDIRRLEAAREAFLAAQSELARARDELLRLHSAHARSLAPH